MLKQPVVRSDGKEYLSVMAAARDVSKPIGAVRMAAQGTKFGLYRTAGNFQWAYANEVPEVWPEKRSRKQKPSAPKTVKPTPDPLAEGPIYPPTYTKTAWRAIPGLFPFEVSSLRDVRRLNARSLSPRIERQGVSLVRIQDRLYSIVDLMMLAFVGPKPYGYTIQRLEGVSEALSNLRYAPRKLRKSRKLAFPGMTHQEIMDQLRESKNDPR